MVDTVALKRPPAVRNRREPVKLANLNFKQLRPVQYPRDKARPGFRHSGQAERNSIGSGTAPDPSASDPRRQSAFEVITRGCRAGASAWRACAQAPAATAAPARVQPRCPAAAVGKIGRRRLPPRASRARTMRAINCAERKTGGLLWNGDGVLRGSCFREVGF